MGAPTHNPDTCGTVKFYETKCWYCGEVIHFYECTCGSKVFFEDLAPFWTIHSCSKIIQPIKELKRLGRTNDEILEMILDRERERGKPIPEGMRELIQNILGQMSLF